MKFNVKSVLNFRGPKVSILPNMNNYGIWERDCRNLNTFAITRRTGTLVKMINRRYGSKQQLKAQKIERKRPQYVKHIIFWFLTAHIKETAKIIKTTINPNMNQEVSIMFVLSIKTISWQIINGPNKIKFVFCQLAEYFNDCYGYYVKRIYVSLFTTLA